MLKTKPKIFNPIPFLSIKKFYEEGEKEASAVMSKVLLIHSIKH